MRAIRQASALGARRLAALLLGTATVAACIGRPGAPQGATQPAQSPAIVAPSPSETAIPIRDISPDAFWFGVAGGESLGPAYDSLAAIAEESDLVVVGTILGIRPGRNIAVEETNETQYQATLIIRIDQVIKGVPVTAPDDAAAVQVEFLLAFNPGHYEPWAKSVPAGDQALLFLVNKGAEAARLGLPADAPGWGREYYAVRNTQGYVRNVAGIAVVRPEPDPAWLAQWSGKTFEAVVVDARNAVE